MSNKKFNFNWDYSKPRGWIKNIDEPLVRVTKQGVSLSEGALALLEQLGDTKYYNVGVDKKNKVIAIKPSDRPGRILNKSRRKLYISALVKGADPTPAPAWLEDGMLLFEYVPIKVLSSNPAPKETDNVNRPETLKNIVGEFGSLAGFKNTAGISYSRLWQYFNKGAVTNVADIVEALEENGVVVWEGK